MLGRNTRARTEAFHLPCAVWFTGKIYAADLTGPLAGKHVSDLLDYIKNGQAYVSTSRSRDVG